MSNRDETIFRIRYYHEDSIHEIYAKSLAQESIYGFLELEDIIFDENSGVVVDPNEERLKQEFQDVICTYIPMQNVIRIDEVKKQGVAKIKNLPKGSQSNVIRPFPSNMPNRTKSPE
jgi:hypothetical protein